MDDPPFFHSDSGTLRNFDKLGTWSLDQGSVSEGLKLKFSTVANKIVTVWFVEMFMDQLGKITKNLDTSATNNEFKLLFKALYEMHNKCDVVDNQVSRCREITNVICDWLQKSLGGDKGLETPEQVC